MSHDSSGTIIRVVHVRVTALVLIKSFFATWSDVCDAIEIKVSSMWIVTDSGVRVDIRHMAQRVPPQVRRVFVCGLFKTDDMNSMDDTGGGVAQLGSSSKAAVLCREEPVIVGI